MPFIAGGCCFVILGLNWFREPGFWLYGFMLIMAVGLCTWYLDVVLTRYIHDMFSRYRDTLIRVGILAVKQVLIVALSVSVFITAIMQMPVEGFHATVSQYWICFGITLGLTCIAMIIWEGDYIFQQWKSSLNENEKYKQLGLQTEFDMLKSQVNPHFLFNCFNTLSALITEDKEKAEVFLDELSQVYRYLLRNNEDGMSLLKNEVKFIRSYFELLKTRHGEAVQLQVDIDRRYDEYLLPSLSLQLLVENAVKHNSLSKAFPLHIEIFTTAGNKLVVNNNIRPRLKKAPSGEVGLKNIKMKYELINQPGFLVMNDGKQFTAVLPLLWNNSKSKNSKYENSNH